MNISLKNVQMPTTQLALFTPLSNDVFIDSTKHTIVVGDGVTAGGLPLALGNHTHPNASESTAGFLSPSDKAKLDGMATAGIQTLLTSGSAITPRAVVDFSSQFSLTDNSVASRTELALNTSFTDLLNSNTIALVIALS